MIELLITVVVIGALLTIGVVSIRDYGRQQRGRRAAQALGWSVTVARSTAIRAGARVSLVVNESERSLLVRDSTGTVYYKRIFGEESDFQVEKLDLDLDGDSIVFSRRGLCLNCWSDRTTDFYIEAADKKYTLEVSLLGRTEVKRGN